jgi:hypothetical protein
MENFEYLDEVMGAESYASKDMGKQNFRWGIFENIFLDISGVPLYYVLKSFFQ